MTWNCEQTEPQFTDYLDGLLQPEQQRAFDTHVNGCEHCAQMVASISQIAQRRAFAELNAAATGLHHPQPNARTARHVKKGWRGSFLAQRIDFCPLRLRHLRLPLRSC